MARSSSVTNPSVFALTEHVPVPAAQPMAPVPPVGATGGTPTVIFLHIPKTAGSTLRSVINRQYPHDRIVYLYRPRLEETVQACEQIPPETWRNARFVLGHIGFSVHRYLPGPCTYVTMLREPIERIVSYYYYILRQPEHFLYEPVRRMTLKEFAASDVSHKIADGQTKYLCDLDAKEATPQSLEMAKDHLAKHFAVVGITERFDEGLILLKRSIGWRMPFYDKENVTRKRVAVRDVADDVVEVIRQRNPLDLELYAWVRERYQRTVEQAGWSLKAELAAFQALNGVYRACRHARRWFGRRG